MPSTNDLFFDADKKQLICQGNWNLAHLSEIQEKLSKLSLPEKKCDLSGEGLSQMDSAGAFLLLRWLEQQKKQGYVIRLQDFPEKVKVLLKLIAAKIELIPAISHKKPLSFLVKTGKTALRFWRSFKDYLAFVGELSLESLRLMWHPKRYRLTQIAEVIFHTGFQALPIIALLSFMIGVVITYQMGLQLRNYGANIFIVDLLGLSVLREFGPLMTAIMLAGRTGSSFTAELGMMKLTQEIDALKTMGITPAELLLLPRLIGLLIALPLLTMWADIFGILGGMVMANNMLHISWADFLDRFPHVIPLRSLIIGLSKAPVFALLIASIGCFQGMRVERSADSIGRNTTRSVVFAIFFIIVADAIFSIIFSELKL